MEESNSINPETVAENQRLLNQKVLQDYPLPQYQTFVQKIAEELARLRSEGLLVNREQFRTVWVEILKGLTESAKITSDPNLNFDQIYRLSIELNETIN